MDIFLIGIIAVAALIFVALIIISVTQVYTTIH